jgi:glycosyltransferase involved in cell wall biosynthesis
MLRHVLVCDNNSTDNTAQAATLAGATVLREPQQGYGAACLCGLRRLEALPTPPDVVVFIDADFSDHPEELPQVVAPIIEGRADLVIGARVPGFRESGAMTPQQIAGNRIATVMMRMLFGSSFTDLGPFRAISWNALQRIGMRDTNYGWTVEMQVKALKHRLRGEEVPVHYRRRVGVSKVSGTVKGTIMAGYKIIYTILRHA